MTTDLYEADARERLRIIQNARSAALVGVSASLLFDWNQPTSIRPLLVVTALCAAAFSGTIAMSGSVVALESLGPAALLVASFFAGVLLVGYLRLAAMPEPEDAPTD